MLAILLGDARGAERSRAEIVAAAMDDARIVDEVPAQAAAVLLADPGLVVERGGPPTVAWITAEVLLGRQAWPAVDAVIAPSSQAARAAVRAGFRRPDVHLVTHPVPGRPGPAFRPAAVHGCVGLVSTPEAAAPIRVLLERVPAVSRIESLSSAVLDDGRLLDELGLVLLASVSTTGALPAALMERGLPLIAWNAGAAVDLIVDGLCGWLVEPTPEAMQATVQHVLTDRWARESAGVAAHDRIMARSSPRAVAAAVRAAIASTVDRVSERNPRVPHLSAMSAS